MTTQGTYSIRALPNAANHRVIEVYCDPALVRGIQSDVRLLHPYVNFYQINQGNGYFGFDFPVYRIDDLKTALDGFGLVEIELPEPDNAQLLAETLKRLELLVQALKGNNP